MQELAREAVSDTVKAFNKQVDELPQSAEKLLGRLNAKEAAAELYRNLYHRLASCCLNA